MMAPSRSGRERGLAPIVEERDVERLALLTGASRKRTRSLLESVGGLAGLLRPSARAKMTSLGDAGARRLRHALELGREALVAKNTLSGPLGNPEPLAKAWCARLAGHPREKLMVIGLNARLEVIAETIVAEGGLDACAVQPRDVFGEALRMGAARIVLIHNHPSGDPTPSLDDHIVTRRIVAAGETLGLPVIDHIVVGDRGRWSSFAQLGRLGSKAGAEDRVHDMND